VGGTMAAYTRGTRLSLIVEGDGERWEVITYEAPVKRLRIFQQPQPKLDSLFISLKASLTEALGHDGPLSASLRLLGGMRSRIRRNIYSSTPTIPSNAAYSGYLMPFVKSLGLCP
jgi:hypothetical protein